MSKLSRKWKRFRALVRGETGPLMMARLSEGMRRLHEVLQATPFAEKYWINGGLLLGYVRKGRPMYHDHDVDFSFWREDRECLLAALPRLFDAGFEKLRRWTNNEQETTEWSIKYRGVAFEFFEMHQADKKMRWYCYGGNPMQELLNEAPLHGLTTCRILGHSWLKPDDHETYLQALYGDWRTPNPDYFYVNDSQAIIRRRSWQGTFEW